MSNNARGLDDFMATNRADLVALAYLMTGNRETAQDVVHDVFARLLGLDVNDVENLRAYARRAVVNECAGWGRRRKHTKNRARRLEAEWLRRQAVQPDLFGRAEVMSALSAIPPRQRAAIVLRYYLDMTDEQAAEHLGCAPATVRSLISRAMPKLRTQLNGTGQGHG